MIENSKAITSIYGLPTIGFINASVIEFFHLAWRGVADTAAQYKFNAVNFVGQYIADTRSYNAQANILYEMIDKQQLSGLIIHNINCNLLDDAKAQEFYDRFAPLPIVSIGRRQVKDIVRIKSSAYAGIQKAMMHLVEVHGRKRIAFIKGLPGFASHEERYGAYKDMLTRYNLPHDRALVAEAKDAAEAERLDWGTAAIRRLLDEQKADFDALVTNDDRYAENLLPELAARGIRVPEDVAIASFDDEEGSDCLNPPLTTIPVPIYEMGRQAALTLIAQIEGRQIPEREIDVPADNLVIRRSCGCLNHKINQVAAGKVKKTGTEKSLVENEKKLHQDIIREMVKAAKDSAAGLQSGWADRLLSDYISELISDSDKKKSNSFLTTLNEILHKVMECNGDLDEWQQALFSMRRQLLPLFTTNKAETGYRDKAEDMWLQSQILIADAMQWLRANKDLKASQQRRISSEIGTTLATTFEVKSLVDILAKQLPRLGISQGYLCFYENPQDYQFPQPAPEWSKLILAYDENGQGGSSQIELEAGGRRFLTRNLLPEGILPKNRQYSLMVHALYFQEKQIGVVILKGDQKEGSVYDVLRAQISSALQGALLMTQIQLHYEQLDKIVAETLSTSEEMQATISETSKQARSVSDAAQKSRDVSKTGREAVANAVAGMSAILEQVKDISRSITELTDHTQQIEEIVTAVESIMEQSKILAINASIQAARAGDQGQGFAVVAREMRALAEKSNISTNRINEILNEIQLAATTAVLYTKEGSKGAQQGMELTNRAGVTISELSTTIEGAAELATQIAGSTLQQANAMTQLVNEMQSIKNASTQNALSIN